MAEDKGIEPSGLIAWHGFRSRFAAVGAAFPSVVAVEPDAGLEPTHPVYETGALSC